MTGLLLTKALHLVFAVTWFAALFYLPRLFVYHVEATDEISLERFKLMERRLYRGIMTPSAFLTLLFGGLLLVLHWNQYAKMPWLWAKLAIVLALCVYHGLCGHFLQQFSRGQNIRSGRFFRYFNEVPALALVLIIMLAVLKPF